MTALENNNNRIVFLDSLRAIAVLFVIWGHIFLVGINDFNTVKYWLPNVTGSAFGPDTPANNIHGQLGLILAINFGFGSGSFGVALFFLISGFVILRTVERTNTISFFVQRFFRIIPTCLFAVTIVGIAINLYCIHYGFMPVNTFKSILTSGFFYNYFNGEFSAIPVLWTLEVEATFYVLMGLTALFVRRIGYKLLILLNLGSVLFALLSASPLTNSFSAYSAELFKHFGVIFLHISYMLIGAMIYRIYDEKNYKSDMHYFFVALAIYFIGCKIFENLTQNKHIGTDLPSDTVALCVFLAAMFSGMRSNLYAPLRWIAEISYPVYLLHVPLGWVVLYWMASNGFGMTASAFSASAAMILLAWGLHRGIELPSQRIGKWAGQALTRVLQNLSKRTRVC